MIVRITGILESIEANRAVLVPAGAGMAHEVLLPAYLAERLASGVGGLGEGPGRIGGQIGQPVTLHTLEYFEGEGQGTSFIPRIIGFGSPTEREFFDLFTTVKGLGKKRALRALAVPPAEVASMVAARDARALTALPEIGKRLAETVIAELSGKVERFAIAEMSAEGASARRGRAGSTPPAAEDAIAGLIALGESRADAERMVTRAIQRDGGLKTTEAILGAALASGR